MLNLREDLPFKKLLAQKGNEEILAGLIYEVTGQKFHDLVIENPYTIETYRAFIDGRDKQKMRATIVDISATADNDVKVTIEMQMIPHFTLEKRFLFYLCNAYTEGYPPAQEKGQSPYEKLKPVITICVLDFAIGDTDLMHDVSYFHSDKRTEAWKDARGRYLLELHEFSLTGTQLAEGDSPVLLEWQKFFQDGTIEAGSPEYLKRAKELLDEQNLTREEVAMMEAWKKQEADFYDITAGYFEKGKKQGMKLGMQRGMQQGMQQGMQEGRILEKSEIITTLSETMSPESIASALKMPLATIVTILNNQK